MSARVKFAAIAVVLVGNFIFVAHMRNRRANSPRVIEAVNPREWTVTLSQRTSEDRERVLSAAFALGDFDVKPLEGPSEVVIPRPKKWFEEIIIATGDVGSRGNEREGKETSGTGPKLPWHGGPANVAIRSVCVVAYESEPGPKPNQVLVKEKLVGLDTYFTKNGIEVPVTDLFAVGRYFVDDQENTLLTTQKAVQMNGQPQARYQADVPHWLFPAGKLAVGESWVQRGARPDGIPDTAPLAEATRKLNRLVLFEGRRAAEIETSSTSYEFVPGKLVSHVRRQEQTLSYLDLETGEPLWFESKDQDERDFESVVRGCNQNFAKHLIRTK